MELHKQTNTRRTLEATVRCHPDPSPATIASDYLDAQEVSGSNAGMGNFLENNALMDLVGIVATAVLFDRPQVPTEFAAIAALSEAWNSTWAKVERGVELVRNPPLEAG